MEHTNEKPTLGSADDAGDVPAVGKPDNPLPPPDDPAGLQAELASLRRELHLRDAERSITSTLGTLGAASPELMFAAIKAELRFDDDGAAVNEAALVRELRRRFPAQFARAAAGEADAAAGLAAGGTPLTPEALAKMTPDQIRRLDWAEVRSVLSRR